MAASDLNAVTRSPEHSASQGLPELRARALDHRDDVRWTDFVNASPQGNVFLSSEWLNMLCETEPTGMSVLRFGVFDRRGTQVGGWALPQRTTWGLHFVNGFDFFYASPLLAADLAAENIHRTRERQAVLSILADSMSQEVDLAVAETHPTLQDVRPFLHHGWTVAPEYTHLWDLRDPDALLMSMNREKRREIRRGCENLAIEREDGSADAFESFLALYRKTMSKFAWYPTPQWASQIHARIEWMQNHDACRLYTARSTSGKMIAGVLTLLSRSDGTAYLWRMGYDADANDSRAVPALYWRTALDVAATEPAIRQVNFGGSPQPSLSMFKDYLGARPTLHFRLIHCRRSARLSALNLAEQARGMARRLMARSALIRRSLIRLQRAVR